MKQTLAMLFCDGAAALLARGLRGEEGQQHRQRPVDRYDRQRRGGQRQKKNNMPGDDMSGENKKDDSVTGDGMMGDDMDGDGENTTRSVDRRNAAASASDRSRYFGSDKTITHENGNLYGKTYLNPETEKERKRAAAQQRPQFDRHKYQWNLERCALPADAVERPRARHGRLFVRRRKYALQHLKVKKAGAACSRLAFAVLTNRIHLDIMKYNRKEVPPYGS